MKLPRPSLSTLSLLADSAQCVRSSSIPTSSSSVTSDICSVTAYSAIPAAIAACISITLDGVTVPGDSTLDLSKLLTGTTVTFAGLTSFEYADANYDMIKVGGTNVTITAKPSAVIDGNGQAWWDGQGSNGGLTK